MTDWVQLCSAVDCMCPELLIIIWLIICNTKVFLSFVLIVHFMPSSCFDTTRSDLLCACDNGEIIENRNMRRVMTWTIILIFQNFKCCPSHNLLFGSETTNSSASFSLTFLSQVQTRDFLFSKNKFYLLLLLATLKIVVNAPIFHFPWNRKNCNKWSIILSNFLHEKIIQQLFFIALHLFLWCIHL